MCKSYHWTTPLATCVVYNCHFFHCAKLGLLKKDQSFNANKPVFFLYMIALIVIQASAISTSYSWKNRMHTGAPVFIWFT